MPKRIISHQELLESVHVATGVPFESIYPNDRCYLALSLAEVWEVVQSFGPNLANGEKEDADHLARRLWYAFKETNNRCACGMVRLAEPLARDVVGVVTTDDLFAESSTDSASLDDCVLSDDLAEYIEERFSTRFGVVPKNGVEAIRGDHGGIEMTLIEPQTKEVFKRSQGGTFGPGQWQVSEIRAMAVWF
ncbi:MAG: hypothetical protein WCY97_10590 [Methanothrix sp.]|jgi:hypothetical protein|uniref:Uncharacterized protein n=1 Tax=Methanothrix harundinacea TaxID=301375 RepID=A0A101ILK7_9EURY|nr:MAG: hypothetical protein APR56_02445 [Methanosaeta sp. SDB]KUK43758.1 MAG: Uncharacterized protein XD72_1866 [Methanothrix harundinacea]MDD2638092.1 hypothetical protein [Methanothrix sp.]MDI9400048.1 hypothetical protein [Euryarchaeota archaeon]KUK97333.1 MAG: Uncharacterized protein XE07_0488 [Methanothrix harundinacea]